ncbi:MAG: hypothetical protein KDI09_07215 [Halioglobus sp.]|nr:hypothetical protein [Halioglobus sp.]
MVDSIGTRPIVPVPRIRRPVDEENKDESGRGRQGGRADRPASATGDDDGEERKGRLIDDQA